MSARIVLPALSLLALLGLSVLIAGPAAAQQRDWRFCAQEGQFCQAPGGSTVRYGVPGRWLHRVAGHGGIRCSNGAFGGDPAFGVRKVCEVRRSWGSGGGHQDSRPRLCARQGEWCDFRGTRRVSYGVPGRVVRRMATNGIACTNRAFGRDPAIGAAKSCWVE